MRGIRLKCLRKLRILCLILFLNLSVLSVQYANKRLRRSILRLPPWITFFQGEVKVVFYPVDKCPPLLYNLSQMNPVILLSPYFLRSLSVITLPYGPSSLIRIMAFNLFSVIISHLFLFFSGWFFPSGVYFFYLPFTPHFPPISLTLIWTPQQCSTKGKNHTALHYGIFTILLFLLLSYVNVRFFFSHSSTLSA